jgi:serine/threonine protein kinase
VVVLDWGIAVALADDEDPASRELEDMVGTPGYMAPEMLSGEQQRISRATDVYMLGAVLYEIVCGHAPHRGCSAREVFGSILNSCPPLPPDAPEPLVQVIRRAMAPYPAERFSSVLELQRALSAFTKLRTVPTKVVSADPPSPRFGHSGGLTLALGWAFVPLALAHDPRSLLAAGCNAAASALAYWLWRSARRAREAP